MRCFFTDDRSVRRKGYQKNQNSNGSFTGSRNPDCKYTGNNSYAPISILWDIESIHTVTNSTDTERSSPDIWRNNRRSDYFIDSRASCIRLRQRFE